MSSRGKWKSKKPSEVSRLKGDFSPLIGAIDLDKNDVEVYLVKMPVYLTDQFEDTSRGVVGRLRMPPLGERDPNSGPTAAQICIDRPLHTASGTRKISTQVPGGLQPLGHSSRNGTDKLHQPVSTEYDLSFQQKDPGIYVFSSKSKTPDDDLKIEGTVRYKCQARPKMDKAYSALSNARTRLSNASSRGMARLNESERKRYERASLRPTDLGETARQREERKKQKESARSHLDVPDETWREAVRVLVFKAYQIQAYYTADDLARAISERTNRIRSVISEVCSYNKSGPFSGKYELKDEFKTEAQRQQKALELESHRQAQVEMARKRKEERLERERQEGSQSKKQRTS